MEYSKLVAVTGMPGLYELINSKNDGAIIRSLDDNSTKFASSRIHSFSHLESIEIFTTGENVNLVEIFYAMDKAGGSLPDGKDNDILKKYFQKVYPDLDFERVYASDLKKMVKWYDSLKKHKIEIKLSEPPVEEEEEVQVVVKKEVKAKPAKAEPVKAEPAKKPVAKEAKVEKKEEKPKAAPKKAEKEEKPAAKKKSASKGTKSAKKEAPKKKEPPKKKK